MAIKYLWFIVLTIILTGCAQTPEPIIIKEPIEVLVPVSTPITIPEHLKHEQKLNKLPFFINSNDPEAIIGLSEEGLNDLRTLIRDLVTQNNAWRVWANEQGK